MRLDVELTDADVERIARRVADLLRGQLPDAEQEGWLTPEGAARHLGVTRKRIHDLKSMRAIEPDGYDGRTPLFLRSTLDAYARSSRVAP